MTDEGAPGHLLCLGAGYTASFVADHLRPKGWAVSKTTRSPDRATDHSQIYWDDETSLSKANLTQITDILVSTPPQTDKCPALTALISARPAIPALRSVIYYSSTGVCGDHDGAWIDETTQPCSRLARGKNRIIAENAWQAFGAQEHLPVTIVRLSGIYGPGRNALETLLRQGKNARRIYKKDHVFNRIHVEDIAHITGAIFLRTARNNPLPHALYNLADDEPAAAQEVIDHAAFLLGVPSPPLIPIAKANLTPMARSFYAENKKIRNTRVKNDLNLTLGYPTYRAGLKALLPTINNFEEPSK